jgi:hypothetical protein
VELVAVTLIAQDQSHEIVAAQVQVQVQVQVPVNIQVQVQV